MFRLRVLRQASTQERMELLARIEEQTELPLLLLAFAMIPAWFGRLLWYSDPAESVFLEIVGGVIWIVFAGDLGIKLMVVPQRARYLRTHWLDGLAVLIPILRFIRIVRLIRDSSGRFGGRRRLSKNGFILAYGFGAVVISATLITAFEQDQNPNISNYPEALWWAIVTVSTVGYGDVTPVTAGGKITAGVLMVTGVGLFSAITANIAANFLARDSADRAPTSDEDLSDLVVETRRLREEVRILSRRATDRN